MWVCSWGTRSAASIKSYTKQYFFLASHIDRETMKWGGKRINRPWNQTDLRLKSSSSTNWPPVALAKGLKSFQASPCLSKRKISIFTAILEWFDELNIYSMAPVMHRVSAPWREAGLGLPAIPGGLAWLKHMLLYTIPVAQAAHERPERPWWPRTFFS